MKPFSGGDITLLQLVPETLPTHRPDVVSIFGRYLPRAGIRCHIVGRGTARSGFAISPYGQEYRSSATGPRILRELSYCLLCVRRLGAARADGIDLVQVRDMVSIGLLAMVVARMFGIPFTYWMSFPMSEDRIQRGRQLRSEGHLLSSALLLIKGFLERALLYRVLLPLSDVFAQSDAMQRMLVARAFLRTV